MKFKLRLEITYTEHVEGFGDVTDLGKNEADPGFPGGFCKHQRA